MIYDRFNLYDIFAILVADIHVTVYEIVVRYYYIELGSQEIIY